MQNATKANSKKLPLILLLVAVGMFGFGFVLVPIYKVFCEVTGLNGKTGGAVAYDPDTQIDKSRTITVQFLASTNGTLPWDFYPLKETVTIHPGEIQRVTFYAKNKSPNTMTVQAIPSVTPGLAAKYLKKTECFCFTRQTFKAGEAEEMPVLFHLDTDIPKDITTLALSYTMFDASLPHDHPVQERGKFIRDQK